MPTDEHNTGEWFYVNLLYEEDEDGFCFTGSRQRHAAVYPGVHCPDDRPSAVDMGRLRDPADDAVFEPRDKGLAEKFHKLIFPSF